jgi:hypothetical protein
VVGVPQHHVGEPAADHRAAVGRAERVRAADRRRLQRLLDAHSEAGHGQRDDERPRGDPAPPGAWSQPGAMATPLSSSARTEACLISAAHEPLERMFRRDRTGADSTFRMAARPRSLFLWRERCWWDDRSAGIWSDATPRETLLEHAHCEGPNEGQRYGKLAFHWRPHERRRFVTLTRLEWTRLSVLLYSKHPRAVRVRPSRGDGGVDVLVPHPDQPGKTDVYQIKKFAENLTSNQKIR